MKVHISVVCSTLFAGLLALLVPGYATAASIHAPESAITSLCQLSIDKALARMKPELAGFPKLRPSSDLVRLNQFIMFNAYAKYDTNRIILTTGMCEEFYLLLQAQNLVLFYPEAITTLAPYQNYIAAERDKAIKNATPDSYVQFKMRDFYDFANLKDSGKEPPPFAALHTAVVDQMADLFVPVIAHEAGHLITKPTEVTKLNGKQARLAEALADILGYAIASRTMKDKYDPLFLLPLTSIFVRERAADSLPTDHPRSECRLAYIYWKMDLIEQLKTADLPPPARKYWSDTMQAVREKTGMSEVDFNTILRNALASEACWEFKTALGDKLK